MIGCCYPSSSSYANFGKIADFFLDISKNFGAHEGTVGSDYVRGHIRVVNTIHARLIYAYLDQPFDIVPNYDY